jgi:tripartite-type tricarboxylate transporter receptor subunit TctC
MSMHKAQLSKLAGLAIAAALASPLAFAQYPTKPVTIIVPWPAADTVTTAVRGVAEIVAKDLKQPFVVNNIEGAGGKTGTVEGARAKPDGYTILNTWVAPQIAGKLFDPSLPYSNDSFVSISGHMATPFTITVAADHPAKDVKGLVAWAKAQTRAVNFGVCAPQSVPRLTGEHFMRVAGVTNVNPVPSAGGCGGPNVTGLLDGSLDVTVGVIPHEKIFGGKVRHIVLISDERSPLAPNLPSAADQGVKIGWGHAALGWGGFVVPKGTPDDVVATLRAAFKKASNDPAYVAKMTELGNGLLYVEPEPFRKLWDESMTLYAPQVEKLKAKQ